VSRLKLFEVKKIRSLWDEKEEKPYFAIVTAIASATDWMSEERYSKFE